MAQVQPYPAPGQPMQQPMQQPPPQYPPPQQYPPPGYGGQQQSTVNNTIVMAAPAAPPPTTTVIVTQKKDNACRAAIPAMHIGMAVFCCILNIFFPGIGTIFAGFSVFCCANTGQGGAGKVGTMCLNFWVGLLQIGTVWFFLLGWIWAIMWGAAFIGMSADYHSGGDSTTVVTTGGGGTTVVSA